MMTTTHTPQAWIGCLACYGDGTLHGEWIADTTEAREWSCEQIDHDESWVFDFEATPGWEGEGSPMAWADHVDTLHAIDTIGLDPDVIDRFLRDGYGEMDEIADRYIGSYYSMRDWAMEMADALGMDTDRWPYSCIDWDVAANELTHDYVVVRVGWQVHIFTH